jgi:hypothetical protein
MFIDVIDPETEIRWNVVVKESRCKLAKELIEIIKPGDVVSVSGEVCEEEFNETSKVKGL